ncbi:MAG: hypothetical protein ABSH49_25415 [Bryobacteraceae bacterium]
MSTNNLSAAPAATIYDQIYAWVMQAVGLAETQYGITLIPVVNQLNLQGIVDPNTGLGYVDEITVLSPQYPTAPFYVANCLFGTFAWTSQQLLSSILQYFCQMTGQAYPKPLPNSTSITPPTPVVSNPVGAAVGDGYYNNAAPTVYTTAGETYTASNGAVYVLVSMNSIFGPNNYWTVKTPAPAVS